MLCSVRDVQDRPSRPMTAGSAASRRCCSMAWRRDLGCGAVSRGPGCDRPWQGLRARAVPARDIKPGDAEPDPHLRSTREVQGYHVEASDGDAGHVDDSCRCALDQPALAATPTAVGTAGGEPLSASIRRRRISLYVRSVSVTFDS